MTTHLDLPVPGPVRRRQYLAMALTAAFSSTALASLEIGTNAPDFHIQAATAGQIGDFSLADALKKGPVVLYFFPAAFSYGCNREAHAFAEHIDEYKALGATVIGVSNDTIDIISRFSTQECAGKFSVAADTDRKVISAYDAASMMGGASRVSYVIGQDGKIKYSYSAMLSFAGHIDNTLKALREMAAAQR